MIHTLSQADIDAYLATKSDTDTIGITFEPSFCLLANTLGHKYPLYVWEVQISTVSGLLTLDEQTLRDPALPLVVDFELSPEMLAVRNHFDSTLFPQEVTKASWLIYAAEVLA